MNPTGNLHVTSQVGVTLCIGPLPRSIPTTAGRPSGIWRSSAPSSRTALLPRAAAVSSWVVSWNGLPVEQRRKLLHTRFPTQRKPVPAATKCFPPFDYAITSRLRRFFYSTGLYKLPAQRNETETKQFQNCFRTVSKLFRFSFISLCAPY